ncbi:MAG: hypothetical protein QG577_2493 [Thermodesulfobacteriota bacterium]|nr:hypothetical protein [Thermodesulfobacteriota bacterium]
MRLATCTFWLTLTCLVIPCVHFAQITPTNPTGGNQIQWNSHQMNQPPPQKPQLSEERLEDIRKLYLQAREEIEKAQAGDQQKNISPK